ncbi:capsid [uncultured virus]|uniref:Capsid n=1 Tax=uncultured virus TaxID=340016 RepID=A0A2K9LRU9_9VIRU|nr:capsid [uncultured virus]
MAYGRYRRSRRGGRRSNRRRAAARAKRMYKLFSLIHYPAIHRAKCWFPVAHNYSGGISTQAGVYLNIPVHANAPGHPLLGSSQRYMSQEFLDLSGVYRKVVVVSSKITLSVRWMGLAADGATWGEPELNKLVPLQVGIQQVNHLNTVHRGEPYTAIQQRVHNPDFPKNIKVLNNTHKNNTIVLTKTYSFRKRHPELSFNDMFDDKYCTLTGVRANTTDPDHLEDGVLIPFDAAYFNILFAPTDQWPANLGVSNLMRTPGFTLSSIIEYNCIFFDKQMGDRVDPSGIPCADLYDYTPVTVANMLEPLDHELDPRLYDDM